MGYNQPGNSPEMEGSLSRVIQTNKIGTQRNRLTKSVVVAIRELMSQQEPNDHARDLAAYIVLALNAITETVEVSVVAWEKRGYWVKADRFRLNWMWCQTYSEKMKTALLADDWAQVAMSSVQIAEKLGNVKVSKNHRLGTPWVGAWEQFTTQFVSD
jgi:thymidylate kinase